MLCKHSNGEQASQPDLKWTIGSLLACDFLVDSLVLVDRLLQLSHCKYLWRITGKDRKTQCIAIQGEISY